MLVFEALNREDHLDVEIKLCLEVESVLFHLIVLSSLLDCSKFYCMVWIIYRKRRRIIFV